VEARNPGDEGGLTDEAVNTTEQSIQFAPENNGASGQADGKNIDPQSEPYP
jgi:hypothetical protein